MLLDSKSHATKEKEYGNKETHETIQRCQAEDSLHVLANLLRNTVPSGCRQLTHEIAN